MIPLYVIYYYYTGLLILVDDNDKEHVNTVPIDNSDNNTISSQINFALTYKLWDITCSKTSLINDIIRVVPPIINNAKQDFNQQLQHDKEHLQQQQQQSLPSSLLCIVLTHSNNHYARIPTIRDTWGAKCDTLLISSNETDGNVGSIDFSIKQPITRGKQRRYDGPPGVYERLLATFKHISTMPSSSDTSILDQHDWILVTEDDTFIVVENLKAFLSHEQEKETQKQRQLQSANANTSANDDNDDDVIERYKMYGRIINWPSKFQQYNRFPWFAQSKLNANFKQQFTEKFAGPSNGPHNSRNENDSYEFTYAYGGSGMLFNQAILSKYIKHINESDAKTTTTANAGATILRGPLSWYDRAVCLSLMNILPYGWKPQTTIDSERERVHVQSPLTTWVNPDWLKYSIQGLNKTLFDYDVHKRNNCCSPTSFSFHQVDAAYTMKLLYYQLYQCPPNG